MANLTHLLPWRFNHIYCIIDLMMLLLNSRCSKRHMVKAAAKYGVELETMPEFLQELLNEIIETLLEENRQFVLPDEKADVIMRGKQLKALFWVFLYIRNLPEYQNLASPEEKMFKSRQATTGSKPKGGTSGKPVKVKDPKLGS